jgi:lipopolysaccharide transport system permease protein
VQPVHVRITGKRSWFDLGLREMWHFRSMVRILAVRDIKLRYRQTALGVGGVILAPLLTAGVLSFVFGEVAGLPSEGIPYVVFSYSGFLGWTVFANLVGRASGSLLSDSALVSRIYVPRLLLPLSGVLVVLVDFAMSSVIMAALMVAYRVAPGPELLAVPLWIGAIIALALGCGAALAAFLVHYRDVGLGINAGLQALLYLTPVAYSVEAVPHRFRGLYEINPLGTLVSALRWSILGTDRPSVARLVASVVVCVIALGAGCVVFTRMERGFADVI